MADPIPMPKAGAPSDKSADQIEIDRLVMQRGRLLIAAAADSALAAIDVRVLLAASDHVHRRPGKDFGMLWPSISTLATAAATNGRSTQRSLGALVSHGYLIQVRVGGGRHSNAYRLGAVPVVAPVTDLAPVTVPSPVTQERPSGDISVTPAVPDLAPNPIEVTLQKTPSKKNGRPYAFEGKIIRLNTADLETWRTAYFAIPDLHGQLVSDDAYYDQHLTGKDRKAWFHRESQKLNKLHQQYLSQRQNGAGSTLNESF